jgi:hypothetical protein
MDASYYTDTPMLKTKYHIYNHVIIAEIANKYYLCHPRNSDAIQLAIEGVLCNIYNMPGIPGIGMYICTDINTYWYMNGICYSCNCICTSCDVGTHYLILYMNDGMMIYFNNNNSSQTNRTPIPRGEIKCYCRVNRIDGLNIFTSCWGSSANITMDCHINPDDMYYVPSLSAWIIRIGFTYIVRHICDNKCYDIDQTDISRVITDYGINSNFDTKNVYFIDTKNKVNIIQLNIECKTYSFVPQCQLDPTLDVNKIAHIFTFNQFIIVIGSKFLHAYSIINDYGRTILKYETEELESLEFVFSDHSSCLFILKYKSNFIVIGEQIDTKNDLIQSLPFVFRIPGLCSTLLKPVDGNTLHYSANTFYSIDSNGNAQSHLGHKLYPQGAPYTGYKYTNYEELRIEIHSDVNVFDQLFYSLVSTNFKYRMHADLIIRPNVLSYGPGTRREINHRVADYIQKNFMIGPDQQRGYKFNLLHAFFVGANASTPYYLGKLLGYLCNHVCVLPFHFDISTLSSIYVAIQTFSSSQTLSTSTRVTMTSILNQYAPFHKEWYPEDFRSIKNLEDKYKRSPEEFSALSLGYSSVEECIAYKLNMYVIGNNDANILCNIARGMYDYSNQFSTMTLFQLSHTLSGPIVYNRAKVLANIYYHVDDRITDNYTNEMKKFMEGLTNDELKQFMITVTGSHMRDKSIEIKIICDNNEMNMDIHITTCSDKLVVYQHVFSQENYVEILKGYLCHTDIYMVD